MRDYKEELAKRVDWLRKQLNESGAEGFVFGNSGGKDSALVGVLCKFACENTLGVIMPCESKINYGKDRADALKLAKQFNIETKTVDLTAPKAIFTEALGSRKQLTREALANVNPRLRMTVLYTVAQSRNSLVVGTGNLSEATMGYFTKWGDGAHDINPIADLTATEVRDFLRYLDAPIGIIEKAPSAGLWDGQTDEEEMGLTYEQIDNYLLNGKADVEVAERINTLNRKTQHKREMPKKYSD